MSEGVNQLINWITDQQYCKQITARNNIVCTLLLSHDNARGQLCKRNRAIQLYSSLANPGPQTNLTSNLIFSSVFFYNTLLQLSFPLMLTRKQSSGSNFSYHLVLPLLFILHFFNLKKCIFIFIGNSLLNLVCIWLGSRNNRNFPIQIYLGSRLRFSLASYI